MITIILSYIKCYQDLLEESRKIVAQVFIYTNTIQLIKGNSFLSHYHALTFVHHCNSLNKKLSCRLRVSLDGKTI